MNGSSGGGYWRTESEINEERQRFLAERRAVRPDVEAGIESVVGIVIEGIFVAMLIQRWFQR